MNHLFSINISKGGVPKQPVFQAMVTKNGIEGDVQKDRRYHGGLERAVSMYSIELINKLKAEGHPVFPGSTGENLTISFPEYSLLVPGVRLAIGKEVILEIVSYAAPCKTIKRSFLNEIFVRISQKVFPGESRLYTRVLQEGSIQQGDLISIQ